MGIIKLSDFGASKKIMEQNFDTLSDTGTKSIKGSPYWMAPEVFQKTGYGKPADVWSLGCCVLEMLTSKPPWHENGTDAKIIMNLIQNTKTHPKIPENVSPDCK